MQKALARLGGEARPSTPEETAAFFAERQQRWTAIVKTVGLTID